MARKSFSFPAFFWDALRECSPEVRADVYDNIIPYALSGAAPSFATEEARGIYVLMKHTIDQNQKKAAAGSLGGQARARKEKPDGR